VVAVSDYQPATAHITLDPVGLQGLCHRYPNRPPILSLDGRVWTLTLSAGEHPDPARAERAADSLLQLATSYADATRVWAEQRRHTACETCGHHDSAVPA